MPYYTWTDISPFATPSPEVREQFSEGFVYAGAGKVLAWSGFTRNPYAHALTTAVFEYAVPGWTTIHYDAVNDPAWRYGFAMAWDGGDGVMMYGGQNTGFTGPALSDTWRYDIGDEAWTQLFPGSNPGQRKAHGMTWDGSRFVLFGGGTDTSGPFGDTWVYSAGNWSLLTSSGPSARGVFSNTLVSDRAGKTFLFGSSSSDEDVWKLVGSTWTDITSTCGLTAPQRTLVLDPFYCVGLMADGLIYGFDSSRDLWHFDPVTETFTFNDYTITGFPGELSQDGLRILAHGGTYYGGTGGNYGDVDDPTNNTGGLSNHTWRLDGLNITPPTPPPPTLAQGVNLPPSFLS